MSTAAIEQFQNALESLLAAVERAEPILISRGTQPVAPLLLVVEAEPPGGEREDWLRAVEHNLACAYGPEEPA